MNDLVSPMFSKAPLKWLHMYVACKLNYLKLVYSYSFRGLFPSLLYVPSNEWTTYNLSRVWCTLSYDLNNTLHVQIFEINVQLCFSFINAHWSIQIAFGKHRSLATCLVLPRIFPPRHPASFVTKERYNNKQLKVRKC